jgi:predicted amidohydrolase YtcJ
LQDIAKAMQALPQIVIYHAKEIVTLDPEKPTVEAVAVVGDRILATGSLDELEAASGKQPYTVDTTFADKVIVPGFIAQHDHPLLAALTMTSEIISIEDWVLPVGTSRAAKNRSEYLKRLADAEAALEDPDEPLVSWGYHHFFHGELKKADLDAISTTRPIIVWHRSAHEFFLNSAAEEKYGVTKEWFDKLPDSTKKQSDFDNAHYWEQGFFAILPPLAPALASPERLWKGLELVKAY